MIFKIIYFLCVIMAANAFLLEGEKLTSSTSMPGMSDKHYNMLMDLLIEERQYRQKLEQEFENLKQDLRKTKQVVTIKYQELNQCNRTCENFENKIMIHEEEIRALQETNEEYRKEIVSLKQCCNASEATRKQIVQQLAALENIKSVSDLQAVLNLTMQTKHLEQQLQVTNSRLKFVTNEAEARKQDFLALLQKTDLTEKKLENSTIDCEEKWNKISNRVILMATATGNIYRTGQTIVFGNVVVAKEIKNIASFQTNGVFICEKPGLYQISAYVVTNTIHACHEIHKNGKRIGDACSSLTDFYETSTFIIIEELDVNDTLAVVCHNDFYVYGGRESGISILQIQ